MNKSKTTLAEVNALYQEREELNNGLGNKELDPDVWPPEGWAVHPENPSLLYKVVDAEVLRAELFGSPEKNVWMKEAKQRLVQIDKILTDYFYPNPKEEGQQRKTKDGYVTRLKTGLRRVVDSEAVEQILEKCKGAANDAIKWEAKLSLKDYRNLPDDVKEVFDHCLTVKPTKAEFDIVAKTEH